MIKKILNSITWIVFSICFVITSIVAVAQNSVPGDSTYGIKLGFEKVVLTAYRIIHKDTDYQIDLTKLRFKESQQVMKSPQSETSFANLNLQILTTQENITNIKDAKKKSAYAKKYINTLKEIKTQLDYEKVSIVKETTNTSISVDSSSTNQSSVAENIDDTRTQIDQTIDSLEPEIIDEEPDTTGANITNPTLTPIPTINTENTEMTQVTPGVGGSSAAGEPVDPTENDGKGGNNKNARNEPTETPTPSFTPTPTP